MSITRACTDCGLKSHKIVIELKMFNIKGHFHDFYKSNSKVLAKPFKKKEKKKPFSCQLCDRKEKFNLILSKTSFNYL